MLLNMTQEDRMKAFAAVAKRFNLKWRQRDALGESYIYTDVLVSAHTGRWELTEEFLRLAGIIK